MTEQPDLKAADTLVERLRASAQSLAREDGYPLEQHAAWEAAQRITDLEAERDDYRERLHDLVMIDSEAWATGGGPGFKDREDKAWTRARELFEP